MFKALIFVLMPNGSIRVFRLLYHSRVARHIRTHASWPDVFASADFDARHIIVQVADQRHKERT